MSIQQNEGEEMNFAKRLGEELKILREKNNLTLEEVGLKIGKTHKAVQLYETGMIKRINLEVIKDLCKVYGVTVGELVESAEK